MSSQRGQSVLVKPTAGPDVKTNKAIDDLRKVVIGKKGLLDGAQLIEDVALNTAAFARVKHSLGRRVKGYYVIRNKTAPSAAFSIYDDNDTQPDAQQFLYLRTVGANVTVDLVVF